MGSDCKSCCGHPCDEPEKGEKVCEGCGKPMSKCECEPKKEKK